MQRTIGNINSQYPDIHVLMLSMHKKGRVFSRSPLRCRRQRLPAQGGLGGRVDSRDPSDQKRADLPVQESGQQFSPSAIISICQGDHKGLNDPLTHRERQVLKLIAEGNTDQQICEKLCISVRTAPPPSRQYPVPNSNLNGPADLVRYAISHGFIAKPSLAGGTCVAARKISTGFKRPVLFFIPNHCGRTSQGHIRDSGLAGGITRVFFRQRGIMINENCWLRYLCCGFGMILSNSRTIALPPINRKIVNDRFFFSGPPLLVHILIIAMVNAFFFPIIYNWSGSILYAFFDQRGGSFASMVLSAIWLLGRRK